MINNIDAKSQQIGCVAANHAPILNLADIVSQFNLIKTDNNIKNNKQINNNFNDIIEIYNTNIIENDIIQIINNIKKYNIELNNYIDNNFKIFINDPYDYLTNYFILFFNNKLYNIYLTDCSIKCNKNKEIILQIIYNINTNDLILWFQRGRIDFINIKIKNINNSNSNSGINYYNIYDYEKCINKFKLLFLQYTGYSWDLYDSNVDYNKQNNKYKIIQTNTITNNIQTCDIPTIQNTIKPIINYDNDTKVFINKILKYNNKNYDYNIYNNYKLKNKNISKKNIISGVNILEQIKKKYIYAKDNNIKLPLSLTNFITPTLNIQSNDLLLEILKLTEQFIDFIPITCRNELLHYIDEKLVDKFLNEILDILPYMNYYINNINDTFSDCYNKIVILNKNTDIYKLISKYVFINKGSTLLHQFDFEIDNIYELNNNDNIYNENFIELSNIKYLWHGTRFSNILSILNTGLKIAPKNIPRHGAMFGNGLYFANCSTKSFNYCLSEIFDNNACLLLCKVSCGNQFQINNSYPNADNYIDHSIFNSLFCNGRFTPEINDVNSCFYNNNSIVLPIGDLKYTSDANHKSLDYDEYVIYNNNQVQIMFIIELKKNVVK